MGNRKAIGGGRRPSGHLLPPASDLPAPAGQGDDHDGQQHLQRLPLRGSLARPVKVGRCRRCRMLPRPACGERGRGEGRWRQPVGPRGGLPLTRKLRCARLPTSPRKRGEVIGSMAPADLPVSPFAAGVIACLFIRLRQIEQREEELRIGNLRAFMIVGGLLIALSSANGAFAQKAGGTLKISFFDNPASMSLHEEATGAALRPMMGVFNNLVMYDQHVAQNSPQSIVPDLATGWAWSEDGKELTFKLHQDVKWHDGKPFTAKDVKCTWDLLLGTGSEKLRVNPRQTWYSNLDRVATNGDYEVTFHLKRPQPALLSLLASGWSPVYPCHVSPREMRTRPIGTGPFKFVEFKPNEVVKTARNPNYWKPGRPYLDGIEWHIMPDRSTRNLTFIAGKFDIISPYGTTVPLMQDIKTQVPQAKCELTSTNVSRNLIMNPEKPPFNNPDLRRAVALTLDRKAFIDIIGQGEADVGAQMLPPPEG